MSLIQQVTIQVRGTVVETAEDELDDDFMDAIDEAVEAGALAALHRMRERYPDRDLTMTVDGQELTL